MTLDEWRQAGRRSVHRGHPIFYRDEGAGDALLCIHGFPTASWDWHALWPELSRRFRVIAPDLIGFGFSAKPLRYAYSILDQADLVEALLRELDVERVHVLAHDYGDSVAQELIARFEERRASVAPRPALRSVCFLNGGLFPEVHRARRVQKLLLTPLGPWLARLTNERSFSRSFAAVFGPGTRPGRDALRDFWSLVRHAEGTRIAHRLIRYIPERVALRERWVGALENTRLPLRLIDGPEDPVSGAHMAERYREKVPHADVVLLDGIGHYPQVEAPEAVLRAFLEFVDRAGSAQR
jgi:pimeloyl-ACP methyl ester carboxylesterase